ncbi:MAG: cytochrome P450, partial [Streptomyces sp.]|nr:cytochrome P450 [Streptomyces sp.]
MTVKSVPRPTPDVTTECLFKPEFLADPYPAYAKVRAQGRVYFSPARHHRSLVRHAEVEAVLRDPTWSARRMPATMAMRSPAMRAEMCPYAEVASRQMVFADPPDHTRLRGLVRQAFTPSAVERMRPRIEAIVDDLLGRVAASGAMDVIADLAYPLPVTVILEMLALPEADRARFKAWSADFTGIMGNALLDETVDRRGLRSVLEAVEYLTRRREQRGSGEDGVLSALLAEGERGDRLDLQELVANTLLLVVAGHETTTNLIGNGLLALLRHPDQLDRLREEPSLMESAVEELLRYDSPVQYTSRIAPADVTIAGSEFRKGTFVGLLMGSANRDPERFAEPDRLDLGRQHNRHLAFGRG